MKSLILILLTISTVTATAKTVVTKVTLKSKVICAYGEGDKVGDLNNQIETLVKDKELVSVSAPSYANGTQRHQSGYYPVVCATVLYKE